MNVFVDYHHDDLYYSLSLLFEKRLGFNLYRPIGMEWFENHYWDIGNPYPNPADTAKQFLGINDRTWDAYKNLNGDYHIEDGIYQVWNPPHKFHHKGLTLEKFKEMQIDIIIASYPFGHEETYQRLKNELKPEAKFIMQLGNIYQQTNAQNVMCSTLPYPTDENVFFYHQEFNLDTYNFEKPREHSERKTIRSFVNLLPQGELYYEVAQLLPDFTMEAYGSQAPNGTISSEEEIARLMKESAFGWHIKPGGDGFGHVIHNWFAVGRPVITNFADYRDKLAGQLLIDGITAINIEGLSPTEIAEKIREYSDPIRHNLLCLNAYNRFCEIVDYNKEAEEFKAFLAKT